MDVAVSRLAPTGRDKKQPFVGGDSQPPSSSGPPLQQLAHDEERHPAEEDRECDHGSPELFCRLLDGFFEGPTILRRLLL
jgi:hypothetical protein